MSRDDLFVELKGRLHLGLISMHHGAPRKNGGIGFGVKGFDCSLEARENNSLSIVDERHQAMPSSEVIDLRNLLQKVAKKFGWKKNAKIRIRGQLPPHVGLGSGTAIRLGSIEALSLINEHRVSSREIISVSGRGGTSGIGINTYFEGGLHLDIGVISDQSGYMPSFQSAPTKLPTTLPRLEMPNWPMIVCLPKRIPPKSHEEEAEFFLKTTPIKDSESFEATYVSLFQIYGGVIDHDYESFCKGIDAIQRTRWKSAEISEYDKSIFSLLAAAKEAGVDCAGMSSLGPLVYCFGNHSVLNEMMLKADEFDCQIYKVSPCNEGRKIRLLS
ncbi:MAG: beta-ribofuranosylaminobenzene 5'-phosphate synthase family protein [Pseudomonadota bacterium]